MATGLINKRVNDLQDNINKQTFVVKDADGYLQDYNKSRKLYKLINLYNKEQVEQAKESAQKEIKQNTEEVKVLNDTKKKLEE